MHAYRQRNTYWPLAAAAFMLGGIICLGRKITFCGDVHASYTENTFSNFVWTDILYFIAGVAGSFLVLCILGKLYSSIARPLPQEAVGDSPKKLFLGCFVVLCICWLPFFLLDYPGSVLGDSFSSIAQSLGDADLANHFPVVYTLFVGIFIHIGMAFGGINTGIFLYSLVQYLLLAAIYSGFLTWMYRKGVRLWYILLALAFYAVIQSFPMYAVVMWKDPLFTAFLLLLTMLLFDAVQSCGELLHSRKFCIKWTIVLLGVIFFRNNGIYIVIGIWVLLAVVYRKRVKKLFLATLCIILCYGLVTGPLYDALGIKSDSVVESLGVPIQQMAYVVVHDGNMNEIEREAVTALLSEEEYRRVYTPCLVDSIKWDYGHFDHGYLDQNAVHILKCWGTICIKNFPAYVKAYCLETFGFWKIGARNNYGDLMSGITENNFGYKTQSVNLLKGLPGGTRLRQLQHALRISFSAGTLFVLWLMCAALLLYRRQYKLAFVTAPAFLLWMTIMLATPVAFGMRYVYLLLVAFPLVPVLPRMTLER